MNDRTKAARILAKLVLMHRPAVYLDIDDILHGCSSSELDYYYFWIVMKGGIKYGHDA